MAIPRSRLFDRTKPVTCHCVSRCVRRLALLEPDARRRALRDRLARLVQFFAIDVLEWSLLTNHFHLVASTHPELAALWSDEEVARRWRTLSPDYEWRRRKRIRLDLPAQPEEIEKALGIPSLIARWRIDLADISVFHKFLKQRLARLINEQDDVTGHCFEGRFKSIVAVDDDAVIAHMVYVALNPVRASMVDSLDSYEYASIADRVTDLSKRIRAGEFAGAVDAARRKLRSMSLEPALRCTPGEAARKARKLRDGRRNPWFGDGSPTLFGGIDAGMVNRRRSRSAGQLGLIAFLVHVDAVGRTRRPEKRGVIAKSAPSPIAGLSRVLGAARQVEHAAAGLSTLVGTKGHVNQLRAIVHDLESAMSRGLANPYGNFSGGEEALACAARQTGRNFIVAVAAPQSKRELRVHSGRRVAADDKVRRHRT